MNQQITECIDNLLAAVQSSQEYYEFIKIKEILELDPELLSRVNAFRNSNFKLQNEANREDLFQATEQLNRESRELRRIPQVNAYLDAELALCKLMQGNVRSLQVELTWTFRICSRALCEKALTDSCAAGEMQ